MTLPQTISVFSEILSDRDYLRQHITASGLNAVCFEKENVCIDNLKSIQPKVVVVQTESTACVWRFMWAIHFSGIGSPLVIVSEHLESDSFKDSGLDIPIHILPNHNNNHGDLVARTVQRINRDLEEPIYNGIKMFLVGESVDIRQIRAMLPNIADSTDAVLIMGEKGVGKELLSRIIVECSHRNTSFIKIDCQTIKPGALMNGASANITAFTRKAGWNTILLDRIHLASEEIQADILLLVDESLKIEDQEDQMDSGSIGGTRFIATAEYGLEEMVDRGAFRKDLFYRLNVIPLRLPPLRERRTDIPVLMDYFIIEACMQNDKCIVIPSKTAKELLWLHDWPGNVDELKGYMYRVSEDGHEECLMKNDNFQNKSQCRGESLFSAESSLGLPKPHEIKDYIPKLESLSLRGICDEFVSRTEKRLLKKALEKTNWNRKNAASLLNISYKSMLNKMKVYDII